MNLLQWKGPQPASPARPPHHSTHKLSICLLVLNLKCFGICWNQHKVSLISEGAVSVFDTWIILNPCWGLVLQWGPGALQQLRAMTEGLCWNGDGSSAWAVHTQPNTAAPTPRLRARAGSWEAAKFLGCCFLFYLLEPHEARQSQMDWDIVHMDCGATTWTGNQFTRDLSISIQANKRAFHGVPLSLVLLSGECSMFHSPTHAGALLPLGTHNPILPAVLRKPEPVLIHWELCPHLHLSLHNCIIRACYKHTLIFQGRHILLFFLSNYRRHLLVWPSSLGSSFIAMHCHGTKQS